MFHFHWKLFDGIFSFKQASIWLDVSFKANRRERENFMQWGDWLWCHHRRAGRIIKFDGEKTGNNPKYYWASSFQNSKTFLFLIYFATENKNSITLQSNLVKNLSSIDSLTFSPLRWWSIKVSLFAGEKNFWPCIFFSKLFHFRFRSLQNNFFFG